MGYDRESLLVPIRTHFQNNKGILFAVILERLAAGQFSVAKETTQSKLVGKYKVLCQPSKPHSTNPAYNSSNLLSTNITGSKTQDANQMQFMQLLPMMDSSYFERMTVGEIEQ